MGSSRLPGKVMLKACGKPLLELMIERVRYSKRMDKIIVATSTKEKDNVIENFCRFLGIECFRGSEEDLLSRYKMAADAVRADVIVRLVSDTPLMDPLVIDKVVETFVMNDYDFVSNFFPFPRTFPDGYSVEVFNLQTLNEAYREAKRPSDREHMTFFIWRRPERYSIYRVDHEKDLSKYRLNLDYKEDYFVIKSIFEALYPKNPHFTLEDIINWLDSHPEISKVNSKIKPYQNIIKSFEKDKEAGFQPYDTQFTEY